MMVKSIFFTGKTNKTKPTGRLIFHFKYGKDNQNIK